MATNDATILRLEHDAFYEVVKAVWEGNLDEKWEQIPYPMIPGSQTTHRCCIHKEREIIRQRVRLVEGKCPTGKDTSNVVQVINAAYKECPIAPYIVTDNCHKCMGKVCQNSCNFGVISMGCEKAYIEPDKCKEYGKCSQACPYNTIAHLECPCKKVRPVDATTYDEYGICVIDEKKCIQRGACIHSRPFGAIGSKTFMVDVIRLIRARERVVVMVVPVMEGQLGPDTTMASWKIALKRLGFADMIEAGLGGGMTAVYEVEEWARVNKEGKKMTTSCCPAFVNMIKQHFPMPLENMSTIVSPIYVVPRMIKSQVPDTVIVFIGPCIAKKNESLDLDVKGNVDYVTTFGEIRAMMCAKDVELQSAKNDYQESSMFGKRFGNGDGVTVAVLEYLKEMDENTDIKVARCNGAAGCKKALLPMKVGELPEDLAEGMACVGGCVGGPSRHKMETEAKKARDQLIGAVEERHVLGNLRRYSMDEFLMHRH